MLNNTFSQLGVEDRWKWLLDLDKDYIVRGVYHMLPKMESAVRGVTNDLIWNKLVSLKVSLLA
jgi:hypothetical protein